MDKDIALKINDLPLAGYLELNGFELIGVESDPRRPSLGNFLFAPDEKIPEVIAYFYSNRAVVEPREYLLAIRDLKRETEKIVRKQGQSINGESSKRNRHNE